jgi:hypothetical protein
VVLIWRERDARERRVVAQRAGLHGVSARRACDASLARIGRRTRLVHGRLLGDDALRAGAAPRGGGQRVRAGGRAGDAALRDGCQRMRAAWAAGHAAHSAQRARAAARTHARTRRSARPPARGAAAGAAATSSRGEAAGPRSALRADSCVGATARCAPARPAILVTHARCAGSRSACGVCLAPGDVVTWHQLQKRLVSAAKTPRVSHHIVSSAARSLLQLLRAAQARLQCLHLGGVRRFRARKLPSQLWTGNSRAACRRFALLCVQPSWRTCLP